jgi:hypothetical protein
VKTITRTLSTLVLRRPATKPPRHRIGRYAPEVRTHPWFEQRAQRALELGPYR